MLSIRISGVLAVLSIASTAMLATSSEAVTIGPGDVYQQPSSSPFVVDSLTLLPGGQIIKRADSLKTWFLGNSYDVSGGLVDGELFLDNTPDLGTVSISGGVFNDRLTVSRLNDEASLDISGGVFNGLFFISGYQGDVVVRGGDFGGGILMTTSFSGGALPALTFIGTDWLFNGLPLTFINGDADITNQTGPLSGTLADGTVFSMSISASNQPNTITVSNIPEPGTAALLGLGLTVLAMRQRQPN